MPLGGVPKNLAMLGWHRLGGAKRCISVPCSVRSCWVLWASRSATFLLFERHAGLPSFIPELINGVRRFQ